MKAVQKKGQRKQIRASSGTDVVAYEAEKVFYHMGELGKAIEAHHGGGALYGMHDPKGLVDLVVGERFGFFGRSCRYRYVAQNGRPVASAFAVILRQASFLARSWTKEVHSPRQKFAFLV